MAKFKVGDIVTGTSGHQEHYTYTTNEATMKVIKILNEHGFVEVQIITHSRHEYCVGRIYRVESENFKLKRSIKLENK